MPHRHGPRAVAITEHEKIISTLDDTVRLVACHKRELPHHLETANGTLHPFVHAILTICRKFAMSRVAIRLLFYVLVNEPCHCHTHSSFHYNRIPPGCTTPSSSYSPCFRHALWMGCIVRRGKKTMQARSSINVLLPCPLPFFTRSIALHIFQ